MKRVQTQAVIFVWGFCDRIMKGDPLTVLTHSVHALFHWMVPFDDNILILSLSSWTVSHWQPGGQTSQDMMGVAVVLLLASLHSICDVPLVSNKGWNSRGNQFASAAVQLWHSTAPPLWIMNFSLIFRGLINMSDPTSSAIPWDLSLSCGALFSPRCPGFTFSRAHLLTCYQLVRYAGAPHVLLYFSCVILCHASLLIKVEIVAFYPGPVFGQCCCSACSGVTLMLNMLDMLHIRIPFCWTCAA